MAHKHKKSMNSKSPLLFYISLLAVLILSLFALAEIDQLSSDNYVPINVLNVVGNTVIVGNNCTAIVAETSEERAASIELGKSGKINVRPNSHDIIAEILNGFNITLEKMTIDKFSDGIYYATIYLKGGNKVLKIDVKPSDGLAIALRTRSPMYINKTLLDEIGQNICK
ncbi:MAG: bifunctional nuclease family protein [Candidatus Aenigmarchaeota archaeon]|nr:bifunctional nuclease family protein [Candidatus Aenigmarchaeota archaeon]